MSSLQTEQEGRSRSEDRSAKPGFGSLCEHTERFCGSGGYLLTGMQLLGGICLEQSTLL